MDRLIYTAVSGMNASLNRERVIASNMANAQTVGFKAEILQATPMTLDGPQLEVRSMTSTEVQGASMKDGEISQTGNPLDIAMQGDTMLAVQAPDGQESYTRRGDLSVTVTGVLQNGEGLPVIGENGPITVPPGAKMSIAPDGNVLIADPLNPDQPPQAIDRLKLVSTTGTQVTKDIAGQFRVRGGGVLPVDENARIVPGALEGSNVNASEVLVEMISAQRLFDMRTKLVQTASKLDEAGARLMRIDS
ncbi:flagellar basal body rod protein FlgF [Novosphingobium mangrovi (ex Huang et al. 2023)]|uniref:Flagellar basal-body rod protein FlgF n=1 Tax=Novosphingobium mangrovi (ex Huang et al. 2023) TaxID=2976432 RepID=A0ABT2I022_9SPHN|nr:flagellar basal body rod protein FlgF [Novosphingobium mangrovi (ex Huang et al. 2023)]MCT2398155.1 flagellar basal body rod protein FlgF [Novosphingobium mangrovi (ex Huang et al. 2023)]